MMNFSVYTNTARFDAARALTEDEMFKAAPSIFATEAHESRSHRFAPIPTIEVLRALSREGFMPVGVKQSRSRDESRANFTKHMIRLRRLDDAAKYQVGDNVCEIILKNANDGTSAYDLMAGMFRIRCMNSLVAQTSTIDAVKIRHKGNAIENVIEGTYRVLGETEKLLAAPQDWGKIQMPEEARVALAEAAHVLRFGDADGNVSTPILPTQLLLPRREADRSNDLWTTFNRVQENCIRGGLEGRLPDHTELGRTVRGRRVRTREVKGIDQDVKLNKALWVLSERMAGMLAGIKTAA